MTADYQDALNDTRLLELRDEIAAVDARINDLYKRVDTGEAGSLWQVARDAMTRLEAAQSRNNIEGMLVAINQAKQAILKGSGDYAAWTEIGEQIEQRRKLVDSEQKRLLSAHEVLTSDRAMMFVTQMVQIVMRHVPDRATRAAIAHDIQATILMAPEKNGTYAQLDAVD